MTEVLSSRADLLIQSVTDYAIYMLDPQGIVSSWNVGAERLKGYRHDEIVGQHFSRFYTPEDVERGLPAQVLETALTNGRFEAEGWRVRKDGTRFWASAALVPIRDEAGTHIGYAKVTRDLTERREAEEALRRSEERFRLLIQGVTDYAIYMLDPEGRVSSWNAGAERFKGYRADEIMGEHFSRFYPPDDQADGVPQRALATAATEGRFEAEGWRVRKDGTRFWASVVIDPIHDERGELIGFTKITRDLTERRQAQEALQEAQEQIFQNQKLEAIGKLTGGVAHDFNNILAAIIGSLNLAKRRMAEGEDISRFMDNAIQAAQRGATLTQRMLAFARKQQLSIEPVDVVGCVRSMTELLGRTIGPGINITTSFPLMLPVVMADRSQLELALMNLVVNARDAMPDGGDIELSARETTLGDQGPFVCIMVRDQGEGMDPETAARAVEPFFTTKGVGKGTGLGLSMVQGMIEQCGGSFKLESEVGKGTTATICLRPSQSEGKENIQRGTDLESLPASRPLRILAVDDDPIVLLNTATTLTDMGHQVLQADSGPAALDVLAREPIDLLLTDYTMPRMTGAELIDKARETRPELKAIIATGFASVPEGKAFGVPRLSKPFSDRELAGAIAGVAA